MTDLEKIIAEMRDSCPHYVGPDAVIDWADRLAALAGAEPVGDLFAKSVPSQYVRDYGQDIDRWVRLHEAEAHAPAKAREVTEEWLDGIVRNAVYRHFDSRGQVITGKNTIVMNVVSDVSAALATFAEGAE